MSAITCPKCKDRIAGTLEQLQAHIFACTQVVDRRGVTEKHLLQWILDYARSQGWLCYHTHDSRRSEPGFPDLTMVRENRLLFAELKAPNGRLSEPQKRWLDALRLSGAEVYLWRPADWDAIQEILR